MENELEVKNYKEKQAYYKQRAKQEKMFWFSKEPKDPKMKRVGLIKGRTYIKQTKDDEKNIKNDYHSDIHRSVNVEEDK